jgi:hypothetical protein
MVRRFVEKENVSLEENSARESKLHLPATRERADRLALTNVVKPDRRKSFDDLLLLCLDSLVADDELKDGRVLLRAVDVVLDIEGPNLIRRRETLNLARKIAYG